jgi:hypothetical protein
VKVYVVVQILDHRERPGERENRSVFVARHLAEKDAYARAAVVLEDFAIRGWRVEVRERENRFASSKHSILQYDARYQHKNFNTWKVAARVWIEEWEAEGSAVDALGSIREAPIKPLRAQF